MNSSHSELTQEKSLENQNETPAQISHTRLLYNTQEQIMLAECELVYFKDLISFLEKSGHYEKFENSFAKFKCSYIDFISRIEKLKFVFEGFHQKFFKNENMELLNSIYVYCQKSRHHFYNLHESFIELIDEIADEKIEKYAMKIRGTNKLAKKCLSNFMAGENDKINLENLMNNLELHSGPLAEKLQSINESINEMSIKNILFEMPLDKFDASMKLINRYYSIELADLHNRITGKIDFAFSPKEKPSVVCDEILKIRNQSNMIRYTSSYSIWRKKETDGDDSNDDDLDLIIKYFKDNLKFYIAPFDDKSSFKEWGAKNMNNLVELSNGLKKYLNSQSVLDDFKNALNDLRDEDDDCSLREFLNDPQNIGFVQFMKECIAFPHPIIDEWNYYRAFNI